MKQSTRRIRRRRSPSRDNTFFKNGMAENSFFGESLSAPFFQPAQNVVQRKCDDCEKDEKNKPDSKKNKPDSKRKTVMDSKDKRMESKSKDRNEKKKEEEDKKVMKKDSGEGSSQTSTTTFSAVPGSGVPLSQTSNQFFSSRMGYDFSNVKIHTGPEAEKSASAIHAKAYTIGNDIVFNQGQFDAESETGKKLMAHELTHVIQQSEEKIHRTLADTELAEGNMEIPVAGVSTSGVGTRTDNKTDYATASVKGLTTANYDHGTFSAESAGGVRATGCGACPETEPCATSSGTMVSVFHANPTIAIDPIPSNLTPCQVALVQAFITDTLMPHEQDHVTRFSSYNGTVRTPYTYTGCNNGASLNAYLLPIHNRIDAARVVAANALSALIDPFDRPINIDCTEPVTETETETSD